MQQVNKHRSFTGSSVYLLAAKLFPALAIAFAAILYAHGLSTPANGHYQNFWIQLLPLAALASAGIPVTSLSYTQAFLAGAFNKLKPGSIRLYLAFTLAIAFLFGLLQHHTNGLSGCWAALFFWLYIGTAITEALLLAGKTFRPVTLINIAYAALFLLTHWLVLQHHYDLLRLIRYLCLLQLGRLLPGLLLLLRQYKAHRSGAIPISPEQLSSLKSLWLHMGINDVLQVSFRWMDKFLVSLFLAKATLALYSNATVDLPFLPLVFSAVSAAAIQHWAHFPGQGTQGGDQVNILHYSSRVLSAIVFPLFFFMTCFGHSFLYVVFSPAYTESLAVFICAQLVLPVRAYPFMALLQQQRRGDLINKGALIDLVLALLLMYPLYLLLGLPGLALSTVISTWWLAGYYLKHSARLLGLPPAALLPWKHLCRKALLFGLCFAVLRVLTFYTKPTETGTFLTGLAGLALACCCALYYEWKKGKHFFAA